MEENQTLADLYNRAIYRLEHANKRADELDRGSYRGGYADGQAETWLSVAEFLASRDPRLEARHEAWLAGN
jgi:hypothetical protein